MNLGMPLRAEFHCHNIYSNGHLGDLEPPFDCSVTISEQLEQAYKANLDCLFVTNHNTLDGFHQLVEYKNNHEKFKNIKVYPAEEVTTDKEAHVLVLGLHKEIKSGFSIEEIVDQAKQQNAVSVAPHPFSLIDALRDESVHCDLFENFNSSNIDIYSNKKAEEFAKERNLTVVAGSDSHVKTTIARCTNLIDSQNTLDDILHSMLHNKIKIEKTGYVLPKETLEHIRYKITNSKSYIDQYVKEFYPRSFWMFDNLYNFYMKTQKSYIWEIMYKLSLFGLKRISKKINFEGYDPYVFRERDIPTITRMVF